MKDTIRKFVTWELQLMRSRPFLSATIILVIGLAVTGFVFSTDADAPAGPDLTASHLSFLEWESGTWDADITLHAPDGQETRFRGEQTDEIGGCGQWLITDLSMVASPSGEDPPPYQGHGVLGFDPAEQKLVGIWVDSNTNWLAVAEGTVDAKGRQLTLEVEGRNPATGEPMMQEYVTTRLGENSRRLEVFIPTPDGGRFKAATIDYTRRSERQAAGSGH